MKVLIWFIAILLNSVITTALNMGAGITLGAIPTLLLWLVTIYPAYKLCQKWDVYKLKNEALKHNCSPIDRLLPHTDPAIIKKLEENRGNQKAIENILKSVKKQYRPFYFEHFIAPKETTEDEDSTIL